MATPKVITAQIEARYMGYFAAIAADVMNSIQFGSPVTGAPGQPVDTGNLRNSWQLEFPSSTRARISTNVAYAPVIEDNARGARFRNHGPHSVRLTIAGIDRICDDVAKRLGDGSGTAAAAPSPLPVPPGAEVG